MKPYLKKCSFALRGLMFGFHSLTWFGSSQITQTRWLKILVAPVYWFTHLPNKQKFPALILGRTSVDVSHVTSCADCSRAMCHIGPNTGCSGKMCFRQLVGSGFWRFLAQKCADWSGVKATLSCPLIRNDSPIQLAPNFIIWQIFTPNAFP